MDSASQLVLGQIDKEASPKRAWGPVPGTQLIKLGKPEMRAMPWELDRYKHSCREGRKLGAEVLNLKIISER